MKHFTIGYKDNDDNICEICEYAERSDEAIKNAINDIPILKNNNNSILNILFIFYSFGIILKNMR